MNWHIERGKNYVVLYGPSQLEIILRDFDAAKAERGTTLPPQRVGHLVERHWRYPLEAGIWLEGLSLRNPEDMLGRPPMHLLHIGHLVSWHVPAEIAEALHDLMENSR